MKVAFIGLGVMGFPMAGHLQKNGHELFLFNRTPSKTSKWLEIYKGTGCSTPAEAASQAEVVFCCVGNDADLREITLGSQGAFSGMGKGAIFVDHTTASADIARELATIAQEKGFGFLDAPVSGGQVGAEQGTLTVMAGGENEFYLRARPIIMAYAKACELMGAVGSGQLAKMVNQICIAGIVQGLAEALNFGTKAGLDIEKVLQVISKGAAQSWQMENRSKTMVQGKFDFGFAVNWMRKDLDICLREAKRNGARLPTIALIDQFYAQIQDRQGGRWDTSSLIDLLVNP